MFYILSSFLVLLGIVNLVKKKKSNMPLKPQAQKTNDLAINPEGSAEHMLETINIFMKVGTKIMNWIKKNIGAIVSILELIAVIAIDVSGIIELPGNWGTVATVIIYGIPVITAVLTSGFTSAEFQDAVDDLKIAFKNNKSQNTSKLKELKKMLSTTRNQLAETEASLSKLELLKGIGAPYDVNNYNLLNAQKNQLNDTINKLNSQIEECRNVKN